jgi:spore germination cell wall hydrolase CwlJ-like protein
LAQTQPTSSLSAAIQPAQAQGGVRALISADLVQPLPGAAVLRLGPADADWSDNGLEVMLPIARPHARYASASGRPLAGAGTDDLTCLTQAVYYESRGEPLAGQEGVAQVVMNRTHSTRYPGSVCGVVFQRSGGGTCQFTFACDGSMDRLIQPTAWDKAKSVASQALGGFVYKPLETATHYHASWMTPYWAPTLTRVQQIGGQIFYQ